MTPIPLAYKYVAIAVMLAEINHCANQLHLPINLPVKNSDIRATRVSDPRVRSRLEHRSIENGFAGAIDTSNFGFNFVRSGRLRYITHLDSGFQAYSMIKTQGDLPTHDFLPRLVGIRPTIGTNEAYQIATNWLMAVDVDVQRLEKEQPVKVTQEHWGGDPLPIFDVKWDAGKVDKWGHSQSPAVEVMIAGDTKDLLHLRQNDDSYSRRPFTLIKDMDKLLAIPDEEFLKYSPEEKSNLVARFSAVTYPPIASELRSLLSKTNVPTLTNLSSKK